MLLFFYYFGASITGIYYFFGYSYFLDVVLIIDADGELGGGTLGYVPGQNIGIPVIFGGRNGVRMCTGRS